MVNRQLYSGARIKESLLLLSVSSHEDHLLRSRWYDNNSIFPACIGLLMPTLLSPTVGHWCCVGLFGYFGAKAIWDALGMYAKGEGVGVSEELEETEKELGSDEKLMKVGFLV